jgi:putative RNA 2'-phosphotransferase
MIASSDKQRHELGEGRIRALYGHSTEERIVKEPATPPEVLFHGTAPRNVPVILRDGLKPMTRQYVHLAIDVDTAKQVGHRKTRGRDEAPVILRIRAAQAHAAGTPFYRGNDAVWLAEAVPPEFIEVLR